MPKENNKILEYNHGEKSLKVPFVICADLECLLEKMHSCQNDPEKSSTEKNSKHTPSGYYSGITCCSFDASKNERGYYREKDYMEMFCKDLRNQTMRIINPTNICWSSRRLQDVFKTYLEDVFTTSSA